MVTLKSSIKAFCLFVPKVFFFRWYAEPFQRVRDLLLPLTRRLCQQSWKQTQLQGFWIPELLTPGMTWGLQLINFNVPQAGEELQEWPVSVLEVISGLSAGVLHSTSFAVVLWFFSSFLVCSSFLPMETTTWGQQGRPGWSVPKSWPQREVRAVWDMDADPGIGSTASHGKRNFESS